MHTRGQTDDGLMAAARHGDEAAFAALVRRHRGWVCRLLCAFTRDPDQAEDLAQEVFCRVHRHAGRYAAQGQFVAWLKRIAVNQGRDWLDRDRRAAFVPLAECRDVPAAGGPADPLALLMAQAVRRELREAILALPDDQRVAIVMRYFGAMSVPEIAVALGCPDGTVKSRLFHGLRRIRARVAPRFDPPGDPE